MEQYAEIIGMYASCMLLVSLISLSRIMKTLFLPKKQINKREIKLKHRNHMKN